MTQTAVVESFCIRAGWNIQVNFTDGHHVVFVIQTGGLPRDVFGVSQLQIWLGEQLVFCYGTAIGVERLKVSQAASGWDPPRAAGYWAAATRHIGDFCPTLGVPAYDEPPRPDDREYAQLALRGSGNEIERLLAGNVELPA